MNRPTLVEFYYGNSKQPMASVRTDAVPRPRDLINIRKETYQVKQLTWAIDNVDGADELRANVVLGSAF